ncbi:ATP-binding protein, partial [bacterium]|nr:ATP-binding protein [bacterium]
FLLQELLSIFIENAIKFNKTSGEVIVKSYKKDKYDIISIEDTGIGIKEEHLSKIFDRFYKIDTSRSQDEGYGIGLSLAREIEEILKCKITVKSEVGNGSVFSIKFSELFQN